jgi:PAS domain S-box-containing protein
VKDSIKILFVEDSPSDAELIRHQIVSDNISFTGKLVETKAGYLTSLKSFQPDIIISDYSLPQFDGMQALSIKNDLAKNTPFILVTGSINEEVAVECMKAGADDYILKQNLSRLGEAIKSAIKKKEIVRQKEDVEILLIESEEKYRLMINLSPDAIIIISEGKIVFANPGTLKLLGADSFDQIRNIPAISIVHPDNRDIALRRIKKILDTGQPTEYTEEKLIRLNNEIFDAEIIRFPINYMGKPAVQTIVRDISARKNAEKELKRSRKEFQSYFDSGSVGLSVTAPDKTFIAVNQKLCEILGYKMEELTGLSWPELSHPDDVSENMILFQQVLDEKIESYEIDKRFIRKDREIVYVSLSVVCLRNEDGSVHHFLTSYVDITERVQNQKMIEHDRIMLRILIDNLPAPIYVLDKEGRKVISNKADVENIGLQSEDEVLGKTDLELFRNEIGIRGFTDNMHVLSSGMPIIDREENFIGKDHQQRWLLTSKYPLLDIKGNITGLVGIGRDITESKKAEMELRESFEFNNSLLRTIPFGMDIVDDDGNVLFLNENLENIFGSAAIGKKCWELYRDDKKQCTDCPLLKGIRIGVTETYESHGVLGKKIFEISHTGMMFRGKKAMLEIFQEVTDRKRAEDEIKKLNESLEHKVIERTSQLESANRAKSEFLANMSHEIRTPMNSVLGYTDLLSSVLTEQTQKNYLDSIKSSGRSLLRLINDILDLSKIEAGKLVLEFDFVNTNAFFTEFEKIFALKATEKGIEFNVEITSGTPEGIYMDEPRMRQIIFNLVGNAIKFTKQGHVKLNVTGSNFHISTNSKGDKEEVFDLIIEVKDTGIGIAEEFHKEIFEPFVQGAGYKNYGGTGLGLAITRRLTSLMKGTISISSEQGKGSIFTVKIPDVAFSREFYFPANSAQIIPSEINFQNTTILVVDDTEQNRNFIRDALKDSGINVIEASDGEEAYSLAKNRIPNLVITDIRMPGMDGLQLLNKLKGDDNLKDIPVIAYSASALKDQKEKILRNNFAGFLTKPVSLTDLFAEIMKFIPHTVVDGTKSTQLSNDSVSDTRVTDLPELLHSLESDFNDTWKTFEIRQPISEIRTFGENLVALGNKHNSGLIKDYGCRLRNAAENFNIETILRLIKYYPVMVEILKNQRLM